MATAQVMDRFTRVGIVKLGAIGSPAFRAEKTGFQGKVPDVKLAAFYSGAIDAKPRCQYTANY